MPKKLTISKGQRFGDLTVLYETTRHISKRMERRFVCRCACGNTTIVWLEALSKGKTQSCGCHQKLFASNLCKSRAKHNKHPKALYSRWSDIKKRCYNKNSWAYKYYGGKGVKMCHGWLHDFNSFVKWAFDNGFNDNLTIDRIDNNGDYEPSNCRWITQEENSHKKHVDNGTLIYITYKDVTDTLKGWAWRRGLTTHALYNRLFIKKWPIDRALNQPLRTRRNTV